MGFGRIFLFILVFAIVEVMVLAAAADVIGWPITIGLVVLTALVGSALFRHQGLETWQRLNQRVNQGEMPGRELVEGIMLLLGGALLITPGFISDATGLVLLLPASRRALAARLIKRGTVQAFTTGSGGGAFFYQSRGGAPGGGPFGGHRPANDDHQGEIIEGEARSEDDPSIKGPR
ncbi:FxsA family protein [Alloalcanivorax mobilis]|uniref:FxsA family protein n=1 Tax=Alloalcanivorax mobilis TaxID=2019569 RepID=UPI000C774E60|nr:FxsA family protein [Alloalcanivorax mobilis]